MGGQIDAIDLLRQLSRQVHTHPVPAAMQRLCLADGVGGRIALSWDVPTVPEPRGQNRPGPKRRRPRALPNAEEVFHLLIDNVHDYAIFVLDPTGRALTWNAGVKRMLGYEEEDFLGREFHQLFRAAEQEGAARELENAAAVGRSDDERWHVRKDGTELWVT